jgi:hypothetical protein
MGRIAGFLIVIALILYFYLTLTRKEPTPIPSHHSNRSTTPKPEPTKKSPTTTPPNYNPETPTTSKVEPTPEPPAPKLIAAEKPEPGKKHKPPPPKSVPFELINNWVVAFGDVMLGKPKTPDFPMSGFIEAPALNLWESGEIPFAIHSTLPNPERVLRVIAYFQKYTPVQFVPYNGQPDAIVFMPGPELCLSYLGRVGGNQPIYLSDGCGDREIAHELMHALGFVHEHSRSDRDQFVQVNWDNVIEGREAQFEKVPDEIMGPQRNRPFDFQSVMIYPDKSFAKNPELPTIQSLSDPIAPVPSGLSAEDIQRIYTMYSH